MELVVLEEGKQVVCKVGLLVAPVVEEMREGVLVEVSMERELKEVVLMALVVKAVVEMGGEKMGERVIVAVAMVLEKEKVVVMVGVEMVKVEEWMVKHMCTLPPPQEPSI